MNLEQLKSELQASGQTRDFLKLICAEAGLSSCSVKGPFASVYRRPMHLPDIGSFVEGHVHNYDHVSYLHRGKAKVFFYPSVKRDGVWVKENPDEPEKERTFAAPCSIEIRASYFHEFIALEPNTEIDCIFALRDTQGNVVPWFDGNEKPYA